MPTFFRLSAWSIIVAFSLAVPIARAQVTVPALAPSPASTSCQKCPAGDILQPRTLNLTVVIETNVAQFYSYTSQGALLVYFVARATFSEAPSQLHLTDFDVQDGTMLEIIAENGCTQFLLKGSVRQTTAWVSNTTEVRISAKQGATESCHGRSFPAAEASAISRNGVIASMYVPNMDYTAAGPSTNSATNFIRIAFSEPIVGLDIAQFNVSLTPAQNVTATPSKSSRKLFQALAPEGQDCPAAYTSQAVPAVRNSTQFYNVFITVPDCFYGVVNVRFSGEVTNIAGAQSLPIKPVGYRRVPNRAPIVTYSPAETLSALGPESTCS